MSHLFPLCWFLLGGNDERLTFPSTVELRVIAFMIIFIYLAERLKNMTYEQRLLNYLLKDVKNRKLVRPVIDCTKPVIVRLSAELLGVAKVVRRADEDVATQIKFGEMLFVSFTFVSHENS